MASLTIRSKEGRKTQRNIREAAQANFTYAGEETTYGQNPCPMVWSTTQKEGLRKRGGICKKTEKAKGEVARRDKKRTNLSKYAVGHIDLENEEGQEKSKKKRFPIYKGCSKQGKEALMEKGRLSTLGRR